MDINTRAVTAEMKKQLTLKGWKYKDLAKATGYSETSIKQLAIGNRASPKLVNAVTKVLGMEC